MCVAVEVEGCEEGGDIVGPVPTVARARFPSSWGLRDVVFPEFLRGWAPKFLMGSMSESGNFAR